MDRQISYTCKKCGAERTLVVPEQDFRAFEDVVGGKDAAEGFVKVVICDPCADRIDAIRREEAKERKVPTPVEMEIDIWVPPIYRDFDPAKLPQIAGAKWNQLLEWMPEQGSLYFYGPAQRGKSFIAYRLLTNCIKKRLSVCAMDCRTFRAEVEKTIQDRSLWDWLKSFERIDILFLDDIGKFKGEGKRIEEELFNLIKIRTEWKKPFIMTSNMSVRGLRSQFSGGIAEPLIERLDGQCLQVPFTIPGDDEYLTEDSLSSQSDPDL